MTRSTRTPGTTEFTTPGETDVVAVRAFAASPAKVWAAYTRPEHARVWMSSERGAVTVCEMDVRVGGAYRQAWGLPDGEEFGFHGEFLEVQAPTRLVSTEVFDPSPSMEAQMPDWADAPPAVNTLTFAAEGEGTVLTMVMHYASQEVRDAVLATGMTDGMDETLRSLERLLDSGDV